MTDTTQIISKFDRAYGSLQDVCLSTKPSTIKTVQAMTGKSETFIIQTFRHAELGDYISIESVDENGVVRIMLPPKVSRLIASQKDSLTTTSRSRSSKRTMKQRMANGWKPNFATGKAKRK